MLIKTLLILLICSVFSAFAQNSNVTVVTAPKATVNKKISPTPKPTPTPTPIPNNTTIRGKVFYEDDGKPVKRSAIVFFDFESRDIYTILTDENGSFEAKNIRAGKYFPMVDSPDVVNFFSYLDITEAEGRESEGEMFKKAAINFQEIAVDGKTDVEEKIPVKRGGTIKGKVTYSDGIPAIGRPIQLLRKFDGKFKPVISNFFSVFLSSVGAGIFHKTDENGIYRFSGLPEGDYYIRVNEPTLHGESYNGVRTFPDSIFGMLFGSGNFLNTYYPNATDANDAKPIRIENGKEFLNADIAIPDWKLSKVSGKVVSSKDGKPVKARVFIREQKQIISLPPIQEMGGLKTFTETDEKGNWRFKEIPKGNYTINVEPLNDGNTGNAVMVAVTPDSIVEAKKEELIPKYAKVSQDIVVENSDVENIEIKTYLAASITGDIVLQTEKAFDEPFEIKVLNEQNEILYKTSIWFYDLNKSLTKPKMKKFMIDGLPKGKVRLQFTIKENNTGIKSATANGIDLIKDFIELKEGQTLSNVRIVLEKKQ